MYKKFRSMRGGEAERDDLTFVSIRYELVREMIG